ncbi:TetR/AcrR family transcriptional regulator [Mucilaginibacter terrenus]|uniref:TetR/AcrR family transcriptional regulator n=1 Tax=Mucilaginibacter terrenus TaxID=2482727 RepID=A0A3E2NXJ7_9SPHI|nr:TetR/AcrR family transcriptional regulator [Mucilaginibacter terrenus]RFZ85712.1 TetR/AcrR family transcriptional regulator [Mucilaginibacter terrenus]
MARTKDFDEEEVLGKAVCLFWHKGYNGTSMQELVDTLGISRSSLYDTYGDKHTLYVKALQFYQSGSGGQMCNIISNAESAKEAIKKLLEFTTVNLLNDVQQKGCFMVNAEVEVAPHDVEVKALISQNNQLLEDTFCHAIKKGQDSGEINGKQDARALARFIMNVVKGMRVTAKSSTDKAIFDDIINTTLTVFN